MMEILIQSVLEQVFSIVLGLIGTAVAAAGGAFVRYISAKTKNDKLKGYSELLVEYAKQAVMSVAQTQADILKEAAADGKLTDDEKRELKEAAIGTLKAIAPNALLTFMNKVNSDVDTLMDTLVEAAVSEIGRTQ